jgi:hypothetical protein
MSDTFSKEERDGLVTGAYELEKRLYPKAGALTEQHSIHRATNATGTPA